MTPETHTRALTKGRLPTLGSTRWKSGPHRSPLRVWQTTAQQPLTRAPGRTHPDCATYNAKPALTSGGVPTATSWPGSIVRSSHSCRESGLSADAARTPVELLRQATNALRAAEQKIARVRSTGLRRGSTGQAEMAMAARWPPFSSAKVRRVSGGPLGAVASAPPAGPGSRPCGSPGGCGGLRCPRRRAGQGPDLCAGTACRTRLRRA